MSSAENHDGSSGQKSYTGWYAAGGFAVVAVIIGLWWTSTYNTQVNGRQDVYSQGAKAKLVVTRRNNVFVTQGAVVEAAAANESGAQIAIAKARSEATAAFDLTKNIDVSKLAESKELQEQFFKAMAAQQSAMLKIVAVREAYPTIGATAAFLKFQDEVSGSENRINVEYARWQNTINAYNKSLIGFFSSVVANHYGFKTLEYYEPPAGVDINTPPDLTRILKRG